MSYSRLEDVERGCGCVLVGLMILGVLMLIALLTTVIPIIVSNVLRVLP